MEGNPLQKITAEVEARADATDVGMLTLRTANKTLRQAAQLRKGGRSIREIAAQLGVSKSLIAQRLCA